MMRSRGSSPLPSSTYAAPRGPVLGWSSFRREAVDSLGSVDSLPHKLYTTSGRAAIYQALKLLPLSAGASVLVPSYHCPTMIAPVVLAGFRVVFYGIRPNGLPDLDSIDGSVASAGGAMIVAHYFGLPQSLAEVRAWCDARHIALIEDCAHSFFGTAGGRPVGAWGDFATASLSKFFPVSEAGLLASAHLGVAGASLSPAGWTAQLKGVVDVFERAAMHQRFAGINTGLRLLFKLKNARPRRRGAATTPRDDEPLENFLMRECDMARIEHTPLLVSKVIDRMLPRGRIIAQRQRNFARYARHARELGSGARALFDRPAGPVAPYVFPLWVDDSDRVYNALRTAGLPVFRWDRLWPGVPVRHDDVGPGWSQHVLQLLCHQDLADDDIDRTASTIRTLVS